MGVEIFDCAQNSEAWHQLRCGIPTASEFASILAKGEGKTRRSYLLRLAGEIITGEPSESYSNANMERGKDMEPEARDAYAFMADVEPMQIGFVRSNGVGCSPDAFIGGSGLLEIKTKKPPLLIECLLKGDFPPEHKAQCQGALWVCEKEWIDLAVYWPRLPLFIVRAHRDEDYIAKLSSAVDAFNEELQTTVEFIRSYGWKPQAVAA